LRSSYKLIDQEALYFITSTTLEWLPVFTSEKYFKILIDSVKFCQDKKNLKVYAYVIMDNHIHMVLSDENLTNIMRAFKGFTAQEIVSQLKLDNKAWFLNQFGFHKLKHKTYSEHQVWQESFHPQQILSTEMLHQKIDYIHFNPVKRGFVSKPEHWKYSSASFYYSGEEGVIKLEVLG